MCAMSQIPLELLTCPDPAATGSARDRFEAAFAQMVGAHYAVALDSPSSALRLALEGLGVGSGDEIITSPYNSRVTADAITSVGARPVFVDVEEYSLNINSHLIAGAITARTEAILAVHVAGLPADIPAIHQIAGRHGLRVIEDAAYAFPAEYRGTRVGGVSAFTCFGFQSISNSDGDHGGMLCTNNIQWAEQCRNSSHRMDNELAAAGLARLSNVRSMWIRRTEIARKYNHAFVEVPELQIPADRFDCEHAWTLYMLRLKLNMLTIDRTQFIEELMGRKIDARVHFIPLHMHPFCIETYGHKSEDFPVACRESMREVSLPISSDMGDEEVERVIVAVGDIVSMYRA